MPARAHSPGASSEDKRVRLPGGSQGCRQCRAQRPVGRRVVCRRPIAGQHLVCLELSVQIWRSARPVRRSGLHRCQTAGRRGEERSVGFHRCRGGPGRLQSLTRGRLPADPARAVQVHARARRVPAGVGGCHEWKGRVPARHGGPARPDSGHREHDEPEHRIDDQRRHIDRLYFSIPSRVGGRAVTARGSQGASPVQSRRLPGTQPAAVVRDPP